MSSPSAVLLAADTELPEPVAAGWQLILAALVGIAASGREQQQGRAGHAVAHERDLATTEGRGLPADLVLAHFFDSFSASATDCWTMLKNRVENSSISFAG